MTEEFDALLLGMMAPGQNFEMLEAVDLIHHEIVHIQDRAYLPIPPNDKAGLIVGVIHMNEEIEIIVKFEKKILQLTKSEFKTGFLIAD